MTTIAATKARKNFFKLIEQASHPGSAVTITVDGESTVVMMPAEDFAGWQETLEIMSDKKLLRGIQEGLKDLDAGKVHTEAEVKKMLKRS